MILKLVDIICSFDIKVPVDDLKKNETCRSISEKRTFKACAILGIMH